MRINRHITSSLASAVLLMWSAPAIANEPETPRESAERIGALHRAKKWVDAEKATRSLMRDGDSRFAAATLGLLLRDSAMPGRASIVSDIWVMKFAPAVPHLVDLLDDADRGVRSSAASALGRIGDKTAVPFLTRRLKAAPEDDRGGVRLALAHLGAPYLAYYVDGLSDRAPGRRYRSSIALGELMDARAVPALLKQLDAPYADETDLRRTLARITSVPDAIELGTTRNADGSTSTQLRIRPKNEFRKDIEAWIAKNRAAVDRAIEAPAERWDFTPEPDLPGLGVSFKMSVKDVRAALDKAGIKYNHHPAERGGSPSNSTYSPESIEVDGQLGFKRVWGIRYVFEHDRLERVHFMSDRLDRELSDLNKLWKLKSAVGSWTGLDGTIRIFELYGDSEKNAYQIGLNYREW